MTRQETWGRFHKPIYALRQAFTLYAKCFCAIQHLIKKKFKFCALRHQFLRNALYAPKKLRKVGNALYAPKQKNQIRFQLYRDRQICFCLEINFVAVQNKSIRFFWLFRHDVVNDDVRKKNFTRQFTFYVFEIFVSLKYLFSLFCDRAVLLCSASRKFGQKQPNFFKKQKKYIKAF